MIMQAICHRPTLDLAQAHCAQTLTCDILARHVSSGCPSLKSAARAPKPGEDASPSAFPNSENPQKHRRPRDSPSNADHHPLFVAEYVGHVLPDFRFWVDRMGIEPILSGANSEVVAARSLPDCTAEGVSALSAKLLFGLPALDAPPADTYHPKATTPQLSDIRPVHAPRHATSQPLL
jgi:hypothetical protein